MERPFEVRASDRDENERVFLVVLAGGKQGDAETGADQGANGGRFVHFAHDARGEPGPAAQIVDQASELITCFQCDERFFGDLGEVDVRTVRQPVSGRRGQEDGFMQQRQALHARFLDLRRRIGIIDVAVAKEIGQQFGCRLRHPDRDVRMRVAKRPEQIGKAVHRHGREVDRAFFRPRHVGHFLFGLFEKFEGMVHLVQEGFAVPVEPDAPSQAVEQRNAQFPFQSGDGFAEGRLGHVQRLGRHGHMLQSGYGSKVMKLQQVHDGSSPPLGIFFWESK